MTGTEPQGPVEFSGLVASIAATAAATLQQVGSVLEGKAEGGPAGPEKAEADVDQPEQRASVIRSGLVNARQFIDTLVVLEQKTKGNLTQEEGKLLGAVLTDLRVTFVKLNDRWTSETKG